MDIKKYKAGIFTNQHGYKSFHPSSINKEWIITQPALNTLLSQANIKLGELNALSMMVPDVDSFIRMHVAKEATLSSRIEGTQTTIDEVFLAEKDIDPEMRNDWQEVQNYITAMNHAIKRLDKLPLSGRLLREAHKLLLQGVRGRHKTPGQFRTSQNWIGGATLKDAQFVPPVHTLIPELIGDLEKFLHNEDIQVPDLIRIGMAHYQFEAIHPFLDGNGRIGRLLITLSLISQNILHSPTLYLSEFFEKNRIHYYTNLMHVSIRHDMEQWLKFFLVGIVETATTAMNTFHKILALKKKLEYKIILKMGKRAANGQALLLYLYRKPVTTMPDIVTHLKITKQTASILINDFQRLDILKEQTGFKRNRIFWFDAYLKLFDK